MHAVVDLFGPTDFSKMDGSYAPSCGTGGLKHDSASFETNLLGITTLSSNPALVQTANPITYITANDPPFFIMHGTADCSVPTNQSVLLKDALTTAGIYNVYTPAPNQGHGGPYYLDSNRAKLYRDFLIAKLPQSCIPLNVAKNKMIEVLISPNPTTSMVFIKTSLANYKVEVFSSTGQNMCAHYNAQQINLSNYALGCYYLKIVSEQNSKVFKIIKE